MKLKIYINANKGLTFIVIFIFIVIYNQWQNPAAWIYLALHGTYGFLWILKSFIYPDKTWEQEVSFWFGIGSWAALALYWIPGWLLISGGQLIPAWYLGLCIFIYIIGVFFHFTSDMQKNVMLEMRPNELITDRMMALSRNINYFGEFLIYMSFALLSRQLFAFVPLILFMTLYWSIRISIKEKSLAQKKGYDEYKRKTKRFIPYIF